MEVVRWTVSWPEMAKAVQVDLTSRPLDMRVVWVLAWVGTFVSWAVAMGVTGLFGLDMLQRGPLALLMGCAVGLGIPFATPSIRRWYRRRALARLKRRSPTEVVMTSIGLLFGDRAFMWRELSTMKVCRDPNRFELRFGLRRVTIPLPAHLMCEAQQLIVKIDQLAHPAPIVQSRLPSESRKDCTP